MHIPPVKRPYFSTNPQWELFWKIFLFLLVAICALILIIAWPQTRSIELIRYLQEWRRGPLEAIFRIFTFLGDDQFFMGFFSILMWNVNKELGFWGAFVLLSSAAFSNLIKDLTMLARPSIEGVIHPAGSYAFPSGHTLTAVTVWGYLAVRLKSNFCRIWAVVAVVMIALSRMVLGYHFLGDILGGLALGVVFLLFFIWMSGYLYEKGWLDKFSGPLLISMALVLPALLTAVLPGVDPPKVLGLLAGASSGYVIEKEKVRSSVEGFFTARVLKAVIGLGVLFGLIMGLSGYLPSSVPALGFIRYGLGGLWVTLGAPTLFVALKLARRNI
ncbi:MAG: phosphatase PAP2 family protein [Bacillota bacterium]|nr:phosphatase PAP2 family protein [Bacillota bacterium]